MKIVFGSLSPHKVFEVNKIAEGSGIEFISPPSGYNPEETGGSFEENALIKSKTGACMSGMSCLSDDSGLCIDALDGAPGIYSARYAETQSERIDRVLNELKEKTNRSAKFVCCMCLVDEFGNILYQTKGECRGSIIHYPKGENGFGYDPIFRPVNSEITLAEMSEEEKNKISHRGKALRAMLAYIKQIP